MSEPIFGASYSRTADEPVPVSGSDFSRVVIVDADDTVDATLFPLGEPVRVSSSDPAVQAKWGTGAIRDHFRGINAQLQNLNVGADVCVFRAPKGVSPAATAANIVALMGELGEVPDEIDMTPRLALFGSTAFRPDEDTASPVLAAAPEALHKLLAVAPVDISDISLAASIADREFLNDPRIMPIGIAARVREGDLVVTRPMASRVVGLFIRVDNENEGKPFDPIANRDIRGLAGLSRKIRFSFLDGSTEGQQLLDAGISIAVKGQVNVDGAAASGGFTFIGTDAAEDSEIYKQIHQTRGEDYVTVQWLKITKEFLGKKLSVTNTENYIKSVQYMLRDLEGADDILGYSPEIFIPDQNSPEQIRLGRVKIDPRIEYAPVFKRAVAEFHRYRPAVEGLVRDIVSRLENA